jgi:polar amino acid transport system substrate-binding protein
MESLVDMNSLLTLENLFVLIGLVLLLTPIYIYSLRTEKKKLQAIVESKVKVLQKAFDVSEDAILILSNKQKVIYANKSMVKLLNLGENFIQKPLQTIPKIKVKQNWVALDALIQEREGSLPEEKKQLSLQTQLLIGEEEIPVNIYIDSSTKEDEYKIWWNIISIHNLTKEHESAAIAYRHKLTNLPNQLQALSDLNALYSKIHLNNKKLAIVLLHIDNFSQLRAIIGYEQANVILIKFAKYLEQLAKMSSFNVYHTFHNDFLLTIPNVETSEEVIALSKEFQKQLALFYKMEDVRLHLTASVGISMYPDSGSTLNLFDNAYKALTEAEKSGHGRISMYKVDVSKHGYDELVLYNEMHEALGKNEFEVYYQPIIEVKNKETVAAEALIRWRHPKYGLIPPDVFIPMMEKTGFIVEIGQFVLEEVLKQQKRWELFKFKQIEVSINMSLLEIETEGFIDNVTQQLIHHQVKPDLIKFEITEGSAMSNKEEVEIQLLALKQLGVGISLDDFGTGYTSFSYLKKFPADILKIDKTLVDYILVNQEDQRIVKAMIELAHNIGMKIVVEGIENEKMFKMIASYECDYMQGYYFSKPLPVFEFQKLLRK